MKAKVFGWAANEEGWLASEFWRVPLQVNSTTIAPTTLSGQTTNPPRAYSSISRDGGRTWSEARPEPDLHNAKSKGFFGQASDGTHIYVYNDGPPQRVKTPEFPNGGRMSLRYKIKPPGGVWSNERTFYDAGIKNSYPTLIQVSPGEFRAVWDSGTADTARTHIHFGKFSLKP